MSNLLRVAVIDTILSLHKRGWSQRRIAGELGVHRETVARYLRQAPASKPANAPIGSPGDDGDSKPANAPIGSGRISERRPAEEVAASMRRPGALIAVPGTPG